MDCSTSRQEIPKGFHFHELLKVKVLILMNPKTQEYQLFDTAPHLEYKVFVSTTPCREHTLMLSVQPMTDDLIMFTQIPKPSPFEVVLRYSSLLHPVTEIRLPLREVAFGSHAVVVFQN